MFPETIILLAGVDPEQRESIYNTLGHDFHVVSAETTDDALAHLDDSIDLVISELADRRFSGLELLRSWKATKPHTPFLLLSDGRDVGPAVEAMKSGAADCIVKPIDRAELRSAVSSALEERGTNRGADNDSPAHSGRKSNIDIPPGTSLEDLERAAVEQALQQHHGNRTHAAKTLGISVRTLQRKLKAWGIPIHSYHNPPTRNNFMLPTPGAPQHIFSVHAHGYPT